MNKRGKRRWVYGVREVSEAAGVEEYVVKYARKVGEVEMGNLWSVVKWVMGKRLGGI